MLLSNGLHDDPNKGCEGYKQATYAVSDRLNNILTATDHISLTFNYNLVWLIAIAQLHLLSNPVITDIASHIFDCSEGSI